MRLFACTALSALAGVALAAAPASAHTILISPAPRSGQDGLTQAPCGGVAPTNNPTVYQAGSTITVKWSQDIDHGGVYRIAFSPANDQGFDQNVLADNIPDMPGGGVIYTQKVTLPSTPCTGCTLQLWQEGLPAPQHYYYSCADIELTAASTTDGGQNAGVDAGAGGAVDAGSYSVDAGGYGGMPDAPRPVDYVDAGSGSGNMSGGCAIAAGAAGSRGAGAGALSLVGLALAAVWLRRRDRTAARG